MFYDNIDSMKVQGSNSRADHIAGEIRASIDLMHAGERLPSVREWMERYQASPVTIQKVLHQLSLEGRISARAGQGTFVEKAVLVGSSLPPDYSWQTLALGGSPISLEVMGRVHQFPKGDLIPLSYGYLDESLQPVAELQKAAARVLRQPHIWSRVESQGLEGLRAWFARTLGQEYRANDVLLVSGGQAAISTIFRAIIPAGAPLLIESPSYFGAISVAQAAGIRPIPVPCDLGGMRPELLEQALKSTGAKAIYVQPTFANPTSSSLSLQRRQAILDIATRHNAFIIEDDFARDMALEGHILPPMAREGLGQVIYLRSLTKSAAPSLRVAAIIAKGPVCSRLQTMRTVDELFLSGPIQAIALELLTSSAWERHLARLKVGLLSRRNVMLEGLKQHFPEARVTQIPKGGFSIWLELPEGLDDRAFAENCARAGVQINAGSTTFSAEATGQFIRLTYCGASESVLLEGVRIIGDVAREMLSKMGTVSR